MALLLALDMVQGLAHGWVGEFEDAGIVEAGHVLFHGQGVGAEEGILLPFRAVLGRALAGGLLRGPGLLLTLPGLLTLHLGRGAGRELIQGLQMAGLGLADAAEQVSQSRVVGGVGVTAVFLHAQPLLGAQFLEQGFFFRRKIHKSSPLRADGPPVCWP